MANEFTYSYDLQCRKGAFDFLRNNSDNPDFIGDALFHKVASVPISPTAPATLGVSIGGTGTPGIAVFTNLSGVFDIFLYANADASPFAKLKMGESYVIRLATVTLKAQAVIHGVLVPDASNLLEVAVFED